MKLGIFYEHQLPRPWDEDSETRLIHESLDQIELEEIDPTVITPVSLQSPKRKEKAQSEKSA